jgi:hypothetical protein
MKLVSHPNGVSTGLAIVCSAGCVKVPQPVTAQSKATKQRNKTQSAVQDIFLFLILFMVILFLFLQ